MARIRLFDGSSTVNFSPIQGGLRRPDRYFKTVNVALDGTRYTYTRGGAKRFEQVDVDFISSADAATLNGWVENDTDLTWTPDVPNAPGTTLPATLINESRPLKT